MYTASSSLRECLDLMRERRGGDGNFFYITRTLFLSLGELKTYTQLVPWFKKTLNYFGLHLIILGSSNS
jgi:hypothetical protein